VLNAVIVGAAAADEEQVAEGGSQAEREEARGIHTFLGEVEICN